tara:strand:- start:327 stop:2708 length:2382 start_codon:yes stop_codon:yes gene_type:complete
MSQTSNTQGKAPILPEGFSGFVRRRAIETAGLGLLIVAILFGLALITYTPNDPSFNNATGKATENLLGLSGAYIAEFFLQTLGVAAGMITVVLASWSWRLVSDRFVPRFWLRLSLLSMALILGAIAIESMPPPQFWPITAGLGGIVGDILGGYIVATGQIHLPAVSPIFYSIAIGSFALMSLLVSMALTIHEWRTISRRGSRLVVRMLRTLNTLAHFGEWLDLHRQTQKSRGDLLNRQEPVMRRQAADKFASQALSEAETSPRASRRVQKRLAKPKSGRRADSERQPTLDLIPSNEYQLPSLSLLSSPSASKSPRAISDDALEQNARLLESVLEEFGIKGKISEVRPGPVVTLYELHPAPGTKTSRVIGLADDIARSMSAVSARIAVVQGKNAIGIELPNSDREVVQLRELLSSAAYESTAANLTLALGKDIAGNPVIVDLARMPHLLVAGTTGSGKSVGINSMILSLLYRLPPDQCKLILIDPKMLELSVYDDIPHLLTPVVTEPGKAVVALKWTVREMENRYRAMSQLGVRNITGYNQRLSEVIAKGEKIQRTVQTGFDPETGEPVLENQALDLQPFPYIVVVVDEMADLMLVAGKDIEGAIRRLAQMARAAGIHLIMATQRPSVDVITGTIKANFPSRISFQVTSKIDSRTILDEQGAEQLLGSGDMLYQASGGRVQRVHGPFVSDKEVEKIASALKKQGRPVYLEAVTEEVETSFEPDGSTGGDELYNEAVALVMRENRASTSFIQRHLQIGYNRAARIIEQMEAQGIVTPADRVGKREVLLPDGGGFE